MAFIDPLHQTWDQILSFIVHAYNTSVQVFARISRLKELLGICPSYGRSQQSMSMREVDSRTETSQTLDGQLD
mgnify:CR=1 FL=1